MTAPTVTAQELPELRDPAARAGLLEVFRKRYLLRMLVGNTVKSRYQGTALGWLWSYIQPAFKFGMYYFVYQIIVGRGGEDTPNFAIHLFCGLILVHFFTETFNGGTNSLVRKRRLVTKLPVPKEMFPVSQMLVSLWHTGPMLIILAFSSLLLGWRPDPMGVLAGLMAFAILIPAALGLALIFSILNVFTRDFGKVVQTLTQFTTFSVPMIYPFTFVADGLGAKGEFIYLCNPVAQAVLLMQRCFWTGTADDPDAIIARHMPDDLYLRGGIMVVVALVTLAVAQWFFSKYEAQVAERL